LQSGINKVLRVHHFGYPTVSFWIPVRSSVKLERYARATAEQ